MSERILVTGATSPVGREVVRQLRAAGASVMAGTRHPPRAPQLLGADVDVIELDYRVPATFDAAVEWADLLFLQPPAFEPDAHETLKPLLDWAVQAGTKRVVLVSAMGMEVREDLPIRRLERHVASLGVEYTILRPNFYMQSFGEGFLGERIRRTRRFQMPVGKAQVSLVDGRDVAAVAVEALMDAAHHGKAYTLTGPEPLTHDDVANRISSVIGQDVSFESCSDDEMLGWLTGSGWPRDVAGVVIAMYQAVRGGVRAEPSGDIEKVLGRPPTDFEAFAKDCAHLWD